MKGRLGGQGGQAGISVLVIGIALVLAGELLVESLKTLKQVSDQGRQVAALYAAEGALEVMMKMAEGGQQDARAQGSLGAHLWEGRLFASSRGLEIRAKAWAKPRGRFSRKAPVQASFLKIVGSVQGGKFRITRMEKAPAQI